VRERASWRYNHPPDKTEKTNKTAECVGTDKQAASVRVTLIVHTRPPEEKTNKQTREEGGVQPQQSFQGSEKYVNPTAAPQCIARGCVSVVETLGVLCCRRPSVVWVLYVAAFPAGVWEENFLL
jgi:hypothetical protein